MNFSDFEHYLTGVLGYKSAAAFADSTKLTSRSTLTEWRKKDEVPRLMAAYINECVKNTVSEKVVTRIMEQDAIAKLTGDLVLFEPGEMHAYVIRNDYFYPDYILGDIVIGRPFTQKDGLSEGFWIFEINGERTFGALRRNPDGTFHLFGNNTYTTGFAIHFGKEHTRKEMRPVARVLYMVRKKG